MGRSRTYSWEDPAVLAEAAQSMSGIDFLRAFRDGRLPGPPVGAAMETVLEEVEPGHAVFSLVPGEEHYNPIGSVHGGVLATLLDSAAGCAVQSTLELGTGYTTLDLSIKYLRAVTTETGKIRAIGTVRHRGRRTALAEAELYDADDRLLAHATSSCLIIPPRP
ncbi:PaaI family thioesterase [Streptomyces sp. NPDC051976]|uniref:PaaI family thioesterase n=1 Tax=Streptomyces sp. NPDC051976 TaxID=3154947 RepID=UPI00342F4CF0